MSIKISEKHGVNPSTDCCFFCGEPKDIILFGRLKNDAQAPSRVITNYEPCDKCKEKMAQGVTLIEASETPLYDNQPALSVKDEKIIYPTNKFVVLAETANICQDLNLHTGNTIFIDHTIMKGIQEAIHELETDD